MSKSCVIKVIRSRVSLRILKWEVDFQLIIIYKNIFIYYYADFHTPNCLMTLVTHDTHDHIFLVSGSCKQSWASSFQVAPTKTWRHEIENFEKILPKNSWTAISPSYLCIVRKKGRADDPRAHLASVDDKRTRSFSQTRCEFRLNAL